MSDQKEKWVCPNCGPDPEFPLDVYGAKKICTVCSKPSESDYSFPFVGYCKECREELDRKHHEKHGPNSHIFVTTNDNVRRILRGMSGEPII